jgi:hypothetical protein
MFLSAGGKMTPQWMRVLVAFLCRPDSTTGEIYTYLEKCGNRVRNITGRMSDCRQRGVVFAERKDGKLHRFSVDDCPKNLLLIQNDPRYNDPEKNILPFTMD